MFTYLTIVINLLDKRGALEQKLEDGVPLGQSEVAGNKAAEYYKLGYPPETCVEAVCSMLRLPGKKVN